jgi:hypothetical protein
MVILKRDNFAEEKCPIRIKPCPKARHEAPNLKGLKAHHMKARGNAPGIAVNKLKP